MKRLRTETRVWSVECSSVQRLHGKPQKRLVADARFLFDFGPFWVSFGLLFLSLSWFRPLFVLREFGFGLCDVLGVQSFGGYCVSRDRFRSLSFVCPEAGLGFGVLCVQGSV